MFVPVVDYNQKPLMPTTPARARRWIESGKATPFWKKGVFCVRLNQEPSDRKTQPIAVGIDTGSKREGLTIKSEAHTYLNILADAVQHVKKAVEARRNARMARRQRKTPYRACRWNRASLKKNRIPPSTKARWQWKLRLLNWLAKMFPITDVVVEDIAATTKKGARRWNKIFSPLQVGKNWFYEEVRKIADLTTRQGYETKLLREGMGLNKTNAKLAEVFEAHCVDSWVLAHSIVGGDDYPKNKRMLRIIPLRFHRRQLHRFQPKKGGGRSPYGGTRSLDLKRGSIARHVKYGVCYVGGSSKGRISLHDLASGKRLCRNARREDIKFLTFNIWRTRLLPTPEGEGFRRETI